MRELGISQMNMHDQSAVSSPWLQQLRQRPFTTDGEEAQGWRQGFVRQLQRGSQGQGFDQDYGDEEDGKYDAEQEQERKREWQEMQYRQRQAAKDSIWEDEIQKIADRITSSTGDHGAALPSVPNLLAPVHELAAQEKVLAALGRMQGAIAPHMESSSVEVGVAPLGPFAKGYSCVVVSSAHLLRETPLSLARTPAFLSMPPHHTSHHHTPPDHTP